MKITKQVLLLSLFTPLMIVLLNLPVTAFQGDQSNPYHTLYQSIIDSAVSQGLPGLVILIKTPEEGTWIGTGGYARIEDHTPVQADSLLSCQSFTKTYTAAAIMLLKDDGLIDLDASIDTYLPDDICDRIANGHTATVRQLLYHTSGITEGDFKLPNLKEWNDPLNWTWRDEVEAAYGKKPMFPAGAGCEYTNLNYYLLAMIIDEITGNHGDFFSIRIFQPLGMWDTFYKSEAGLPRPPGAVDIYFDRYQDGFIENVSDINYERQANLACGASGIIASMSDHARFLEALFTGLLVSPSSLEEMKIGAPVAACSWRGLGIGLILWADNQGSEILTLGGEGSGMAGMTKAYYIPEFGIIFCFSTNIGSKNNLHWDIFNGLYNQVMNAVINGRAQTMLDLRRTPRELSGIKKTRIKK